MSTPAPYSAAAWHKARLDLMGFMRCEGRMLPEDMKQFARWLYGTEYLHQHHSPPWSTKAPEYVADIYAFLAQAGAMLGQEPELKQAA